MLKVETNLIITSRHGLTCVAGEPIPAGTLVWARDHEPGLTADEVETLEPVAAAFVDRNAPVCDGTAYLMVDNARFINHSSTPNIGYKGGDRTKAYALVDINRQEELLIDYRQSCDDSAECLEFEEK